MKKRPLKLKSIVEEVLNLLRASLPASIEIEKVLNSDSHILADPTQIQPGDYESVHQCMACNEREPGCPQGKALKIS